MEQSGRITREQAKRKREAAALIEEGFSDDLKHDALMFSRAGIASEKELIEIMNEKNRSGEAESPPEDLEGQKQELQEAQVENQMSPEEQLSSLQERLSATQEQVATLSEQYGTMLSQGEEQFSKLSERYPNLASPQSLERFARLHESMRQRLAESGRTIVVIQPNTLSPENFGKGESLIGVLEKALNEVMTEMKNLANELKKLTEQMAKDAEKEAKKAIDEETKKITGETEKKTSGQPRPSSSKNQPKKTA